MQLIKYKAMPKWRGYGRDGFPRDAWVDPRYHAWFKRHQTSRRELAKQRKAKFAINPTFSIVVPLYKTPLDYLSDMVDSILAQTYPNLELVLVNASPENAELKDAVDAYARADSRIKVVSLDANLGITENTNEGLKVATGDFCCFCDHDDWIEPDLLHDYVKAINENPEIDLLYCDEDLADSNHHYLHPMFKPDFSPELLLSKNYIVHMMTIRRNIIDSMPRPDSQFDGAQDFNMVLYAAEQARSVHHTPKVQYHWRISDTSTAADPTAKPYGRRAGRKATYNHYQRAGIDASINYSGIINTYNPSFNEAEEKRCSIIIRQTSSVDALINCVQALKQSEPAVHQFVLITDEREAVVQAFPGENLAFVEPKTRLYADFNEAAAAATGDYLVFLDDTCVPLTAHAVTQLACACSLDGVGVVGPKGFSGTTPSTLMAWP